MALWRWAQVGAASGTLQVRIVDALSRTPIVEVDSKATAWWTVGGAVRQLVKRAFDQTGLSRYSQEQHAANVRLLFPARPRLEISEREFKNQPLSSEIEGLWSDEKNLYTVAITKAPANMDFDYVGVVVTTSSPVWSPNEIKMELKTTAGSKGAFIGNFYPASKKRIGTMFRLEGEGVLKFSIDGPQSQQISLAWIKSWPVATLKETRSNPARPAGTTVSGSGTGFLISSDGLIATNWHVVEGATSIQVRFPWQADPVDAKVAIKDPANDLAILELPSREMDGSPCVSLPYEMKKASLARLGGKVSTIGYPLDGLLGAGAKYTDGSISALSGLRDDVRFLQVSAPIQPGSSGSPLIDEGGSVIGVIVSTFSPAIQFKLSETLPQNINFAIRADYLLNLMEMLPRKPKIVIKKAVDASGISSCVGVIRVAGK